jgi:TonB family protein
MRTEWWSGAGSGNRWPRCVLGSGLAHLVLFGACLLIQPVSEQVRPTLRVRLVEEESTPLPTPIPAEALPTLAPTRVVTPSPPKRRRLSLKSIPPMLEAPAAQAPAVELLPASPPTPKTVHDEPVVASHSQSTPVMASPTPPSAAPPFAPLTKAPPGLASEKTAADALGSPGAGDEGTFHQAHGGSGPPVPSGGSDTEPKGVVLLSRQGNGVGTGNGPGAGSGNDLGRGTGAGWGAGSGGGEGAVGAPSMLSRGGSRVAANGRTDAELLRVIRRQIERVWTYPDTARRDGLEGRVELRFRIGADGSAEAVEILKPSGHAVLDDDLVQTVRRAGPYPVYGGWVRLPFTYRLDQ